MMLDAALSYIDLGWNVFPLHTPNGKECSCRKSNCSNIGKHPRTMNGLRDATTEKTKVEYWWGMWPEANIGVATGAVSNLIALDIDPRHHGDESVKALQAKHGGFTDKVWARTGGGGWHLLFRHPGVKIGNIQSTPDRPGKLGTGLDVRGDGGYIVVSPSLHASSNRYKWGTEPSAGLPAVPEWLLTILSTPAPQASLVLAEGAIPDGCRNNTLASLAGTMRRRGMSQAGILAALRVENETRCDPPLEDSVVCRVAQSIGSKTPEDPIVATEPELETGIYTVDDLSEAIDELYEEGLTGGASTGWRRLDQFYTVKRGQWSVVTGMPSHGKSAFLDAMLVNLALNQDWRFCVCSPENQPLQRHAATLMTIWAGQPFAKGYSERMSVEVKEKAKQWLADHFTFVLPHESECTVDGILLLASAVHSRRPIQGLIIDPWNELEHRRPPAMSETEYVSQSLTRMRRHARTNEIHLWLVVHPTKLQKDPKTNNYPVPTLYDCSGSAHFRNKADMGLVVWRDLLEPHTPSEIHVQKVRFKECGQIGKAELYFDRLTNRYSEQPGVFSVGSNWVGSEYEEAV